MTAPKCIVILSEKSSGSSACQNLLAKFEDIKYVQKTRHYENETLYWTKAASILGLPQRDMLDSEVPIERDRARTDLITLLRDNLDDYSPADDDRSLIFDGWRQLCESYTPIFVEKSPHHLFQWSALELIVECQQRYPEIDFLLLGLIRNPMDTIYSQFQRWRAHPEKLQAQWLVAYQNLLKLKEVAGEKLVIIRYEDMVSSLSYLQPVFQFCEAKVSDADQHYLHRDSLMNWKRDSTFGFALSEEVISLAQRYGYQLDELQNEPTMFWPVYRDFTRTAHRIKVPLRTIARNSLNGLRTLRARS